MRRLAACTAMLGLGLLVACTASSDQGARVPLDQQASTSAESVAGSTTTAPTTTTTAPTTTAPTTTAPTTTFPTATTLVVPPGPLFGIAVPEGRINDVRNIEAAGGETFHLIRVFLRWEDEVGDSDIAAMQEGGRAIHLSVRPLRADGTVIAWADIARAPEGSALHDEMVAWADAVVALGPDTRFTFNHEPETRESMPNGDALDYRGAWRRMVELVRERGGDEIDMVWTVGAELLREPSGRDYYPGDDVVDVIGADLYNWFTCQGTNRPWTSFEDLIEPAVVFAAARDKSLALPEFASASDPIDPARRAGWMDAAVDVMVGWDPAERSGVELDFVAWFDVTSPGGTNPNCRWSHRGDEDTAAAFNRMLRDLIGTSAVDGQN